MEYQDVLTTLAVVYQAEVRVEYFVCALEHEHKAVQGNDDVRELCLAATQSRKYLHMLKSGTETTNNELELDRQALQADWDLAIRLLTAK